MNNQKLKFHKDVKLFDIDGIHMIGNFNNHSIIGLTPEGLNLVKSIMNGDINHIDQINFDSLSDNLKTLLDALSESKYFDPDVDHKLTSAYLHVTDNCNLHCVGCYSYKDRRNERENLSTGDIKRMIRILADNGVSFLVISGGEPFLRDDLSEILKFAKEDVKMEHLSIISNGTMSLDRYEKAIPYLNNISISIDGYDTNSRFIRDPGIMPIVFDTITNLKDKCKKNNCTLALIATLHNKTSPIIKKYAQLSNDIDVPLSFSILTVDYSNPLFKNYILTDTDYKMMYDYLSENNDIVINDSLVGQVGIFANKGCGVGKGIISIGADGTIYPCQMLHCDELSLGNLLYDDLNEVLNSNKNIFKNIYVDNLTECNECKFKYICGGGCRASSYYQHKDVLHPEVSCKQAKIHFQDLIDSIKKQYSI